MPDRLKSTLAIAGSLVLAAGLLYLSLRNADFGAVAAALRGGSYGWLVPMATVSVLSVVIRAWRWTLLLRALPDEAGAEGPRPTVGLALGATFIGYLVNYVAPRAGEIARAANVSAKSRPTFSATLGTVVAERLLDVATLALALLSVLALYGGRVAFVTEGLQRTSSGALERLPVQPAVLVLGVVVVAVLVGLALWVVARRASSRIVGMMAGFRDGLTALVRTRRPVALVASTVAMWACYWIMADLPLRLLGLADTYSLGLGAAWAVMCIGAVGMAIPSPGGAGSYHYATVQALTLLFGVGASGAATYALLAHAAQLVFYAVCGFAALLVQGTSLRAVRQPTPVP